MVLIVEQSKKREGGDSIIQTSLLVPDWSVLLGLSGSENASHSIGEQFWRKYP